MVEVDFIVFNLWSTLMDKLSWLDLNSSKKFFRQRFEILFGVVIIAYPYTISSQRLLTNSSQHQDEFSQYFFLQLY